jgi:aspartate dehydrogenase
MRKVARKKGCNVYLPSGAILGIDGINAASLSDVRKIKLTTRKSPSSLGLKVKGRKKILSAKAKEAVKLFPRNINVAASVALSSGKDIRVEIIAEPGIDKNIHELFIETSLGNFLVKVENLPSAENPKSSLLAAKSVVALLKKLEEPIKVGT